MILAADIGATNTRLGLFSGEGARASLVASRRFLNRNYHSMRELLEDFIQNPREIAAVSIGVAGLVTNGHAYVTNLGWDIDSALFRETFPLARISLLNDVEAIAYGISSLAESDLLVLNPGQRIATAPAALIASGTGLGEAIIYSRGDLELIAASEAGHADFAPADGLQVQLLEFLWRSFRPVSWDRVLSGPGLATMYEFLRDQDPGRELRAIASRLRSEDPGAVIAGAGMNGECELCVAALDLFASVYGSEAGNHALRSLARRGVYLGGGIAPKIAAKLAEGAFMRFFCNKDRMGNFLSTIPVYVIMNDNAALMGAVRYASSGEEKAGSPGSR